MCNVKIVDRQSRFSKIAGEMDPGGIKRMAPALSTETQIVTS